MSEDRSKEAAHPVPLSPPGQEGDAGATPIVQPPVQINLAFYTTGDTRHFHGFTVNTISDTYRRMGEVLAPGQVHGVQTRQDAIQTITALPQGNCIHSIYFIGHGWSNRGRSGFFFSGTGLDRQGVPLGLDDFHATAIDGTVADNSHRPLISAIAGRSCQGETLDIEFLCCYAGGYAGGGDLLQAIENQLTEPGTGIQQYRIAGTPHEFRFEADENRTGDLSNWDNHLMNHSTVPPQRIADTTDPLSPHRGIIPGGLRVLESLP